MPSIPAPAPHSPPPPPPSVPAVTPRAQPAPTQVVVDLSTAVTIQSFSRFYPSVSPDTFQPVYYTLADGSLLAPPLLDDLRISNVFLVIIGCLLAIFVRNSFISALYAWRGKVKKKGLLYILFLSQILGPIAIIPIIVAQFNRSASCAVILRITSITSGASLSLLLTGILGAKVYKCMDNNRLVLASLVVLSTAAVVILVLDVINLQSFRSLSGTSIWRCYRPSAGLSSVFVMVLLTESFFVCACFLHVVWKSHGPVVVRGRISVQPPLDDDTRSHAIELRREKAYSTRARRDWFDGGPPVSYLLTSQRTQHPPSLSREPSLASIHHDESPRTRSHNAPASSKTVQNPQRPIPFPSTIYSRTAPHSCTVGMSDTADGPHLLPRVATPLNRSTSPVHSSTGHFARYVPKMSLFREVMRDELCYTAVITAFTVVSVAMTLVGVKSAGGINTTIWITFDWALVSLLVMHSFGRVIQRHENETLLLHSSAWYHDLHTDRTTAELLRDASQPVRSPRALLRPRARRPVARGTGGASLSDLSTCRLFPGSAHSSRGDLHSLGASTSGTSTTFPPIGTEPLTRTHTDRPHAARDEGCTRPTVSMEDLPLGRERSQTPSERRPSKKSSSTPSPHETAGIGQSFDGSAHVS